MYCLCDCIQIRKIEADQSRELLARNTAALGAAAHQHSEAVAALSRRVDDELAAAREKAHTMRDRERSERGKQEFSKARTKVATETERVRILAAGLLLVCC